MVRDANPYLTMGNDLEEETTLLLSWCYNNYPSDVFHENKP